MKLMEAQLQQVNVVVSNMQGKIEAIDEAIDQKLD